MPEPQANEDQQADTKTNEDVDVANKNIDVGSEYE